jgi:hypothetical protein
MRLAQQRSQALLTLLPILRLQPAGFRNADARPLIAQLRGLSPEQITTGQMTYDLRRLRAHGFIQRIPRTHRYRVTDHALHTALILTHINDRLLPEALDDIRPNTPTSRRCGPQHTPTNANWTTSPPRSDLPPEKLDSKWRLRRVQST